MPMCMAATATQIVFETDRRVSLRDARAAMLAAATPLPAEECSLDAARARALARTVRARDDLIPFTRCIGSKACAGCPLVEPEIAKTVGLKHGGCDLHGGHGWAVRLRGRSRR
jgi:hypothetical protein